MKPRTTLIVGGIILLVLVVGAIVIGILVGKPSSNQLASGTSSAGTSLPPDPSTFPTGTTITLGTAKGTVTMNNFYTTMSDYYEGQLTFKSAPNYILTYNTLNSSFWIDVTGGDPTTVEKTAEADFVSTLGISQNEACELNASWGVDYSVSPTLAGRNYPFTFCSVQ